MKFLSLSLIGFLLAGFVAPGLAQSELPAAAPKPKSESELHASRLLAEAKAKLQSIDSLIVDFEPRAQSAKNFDRRGEIVLARPAKFRIVGISGSTVERRKLLAVCDGQKVTKMNEQDFIAYEKPVHLENFFLGQNFLVQFFFDSKPLSFDPTDAIWGRSVSLYDTNASAYDRDVKTRYLGKRTLEDTEYEVVEIKYNTYQNDIRQQVYIGADRLIYQVDTYFDGIILTQKFRNYRMSPVLEADAFRLTRTEKMPLVATDPVRLGEPAPDFTLPGYNGGELSYKELLKNKKGLLICVLDGTLAKALRVADAHLPQMRVLQELKDKFEKQGLGIVCIVGGPGITPDLISEMKLNWMPDVSRFNYPIAIDVDLERGIQGAAFENLQLNGRNNLLLDKDGKVVFACQSLVGKSNQLMVYQSLAQLGFAVSQADLDAVAR